MTNEEIFERQAETNLLAFEEEAALWKEEMRVAEEELSRCRKEFLEGVDEQLNRLEAQAEQSLVAIQGTTESAALLASKLLAVEAFSLCLRASGKGIDFQSDQDGTEHDPTLH